jgi:hypothetical protein
MRSGDEVTVLDAPSRVAFGDCYTRPARATVRRAGLLERAWTRMVAPLEMLELYEVGFQPKE